MTRRWVDFREFQFTKMFGLQEVDALIQEMLLSRDDTDPIFRLNSPTSAAPPRQEMIDLPSTAPQQHQPDAQGQRQSFLVTSENQCHKTAFTFLQRSQTKIWKHLCSRLLCGTAITASFDATRARATPSENDKGWNYRMIFFLFEIEKKIKLG